MPIDVDYIVAKSHIDKLQELLSNVPHGEREGIADEIIEFVENMERKWTKYQSQEE